MLILSPGPGPCPGLPGLTSWIECRSFLGRRRSLTPARATSPFQWRATGAPPEIPQADAPSSLLDGPFITQFPWQLLPACFWEAGRYSSDYGPQLWSPRHSGGGGPKEQDEGDDGPGRLCGLLSGEIQTAFQTLPLHSAACSGGATLRGCHALGVPHSGGLGSDIHLTNTYAPLWKTLVRPWAHGRLRSCHVRQQPGGRWILMGHFTALR